MANQIDLSGFIGTTQYFKHPLSSLMWTDGVKYLTTEGECHWLIDIVWSYMHKVGHYPFLVWELEVDTEKSSAVITAREDTGMKPVVKQEIPYTDFHKKTGLSGIKLYLQNNVLMLTSEY